MNEATAMFYAIADRTARAYKSHRYMSAKAVNSYANVVFKDYFHHGKSFGRRLDIDDVREGFHEHREFLISAILDAQEGDEWEQTPMYRFFKMKFPDDFSRIKAQKAPKSYAKADGAVPDKAKEHKAAKSSDETTQRPTQANSSHRNRKGRPPKQRPPGRSPQTPTKQIVDVTEILDATPSSGESHEHQGRKNVSRKRKSILQPKSNKRTKKGIGKGRSTVNRVDEAENEDEDTVPSHAEQPQPTSPLAEAMKRGPSRINQRKLLKPTATLHDTQQSSPPLSISSASSSSMTSATDLQNKNPPDYRLSGAPSSVPPLKFKEQELWRCSFDDCTFAVSNEFTVQGKADIHDHFQTHSDQAPGMIDLVLREARPYLPVSNLVRRLQMFAEAGLV